MVIIDEMERRIKLKTLNSHITCKICRGYLIDATTVTECLHTFCKSCLVKHLEEKHTCPTCQIVIHQSHPLQYISFDRTMQDIVYKLVPDLQESKSFISVSIFSVFFYSNGISFFQLFDGKLFSISDEIKREREFYRARGLPCPKDILPNAGEIEEERANADAHAESDYHRTDEQVRATSYQAYCIDLQEYVEYLI